MDRIRAYAGALHLDAIGSTKLMKSAELESLLKKAGPLPFVPSDIEKRMNADALLPGARSAIVILFPYGYFPWEDGNISIYARPKDYHKVCHHYMERLITRMKADFPEEEFYPLVDTSPLVDRWLAYSAGLGFFGKNHCIINSTYGSYVSIASILTTLDLPQGTPIPCQCGSCHKCIARCPGHALSEKGFNPWVCKSYLTQKKEPLTDKEKAIIRRTPLIFGCDECQRNCPFNDKALSSPLPEIKEERIPNLSREELESTSNRAFLKKYKDYAFTWRGKKILLRNLDIIESNDGSNVQSAECKELQK